MGPTSGACGDWRATSPEVCQVPFCSPHSAVDVRGLDRGFQKPKEGWETLGKPGSRRVAESRRSTGRLTEGRVPCPPHAPSQKVSPHHQAPPSLYRAAPSLSLHGPGLDTG